MGHTPLLWINYLNFPDESGERASHVIIINGKSYILEVLHKYFTNGQEIESLKRPLE